MINAPEDIKVIHQQNRDHIQEFLDDTKGNFNRSPLMLTSTLARYIIDVIDETVEKRAVITDLTDDDLCDIHLHALTNCILKIKDLKMILKRVALHGATLQ